MNESIKAGSDIHAGDGGYSIGTQEKYNEFVKFRNKSRIQKLAEQVYGSQATEQEIKFAELIVQECANQVDWILAEGGKTQGDLIKQHFGVEESKGWVCPKCSADRTKIACPLGFGATVDGRCPMTVEAQ